MGWFRRGGSGARVAEVGQIRLAAPEEARRTLLRVTAEALILQDEAAAVIAGVRSRQPLGVLAPWGGPLVHRFFCLRDRLPPRCEAGDDERLRALLSTILHHHAMLVATALDFAAYEGQSEQLARQVDALDGLGAPGGWLEEVYAELTSSPTAPVEPSPRGAGP